MSDSDTSDGGGSCQGTPPWSLSGGGGHTKIRVFLTHSFLSVWKIEIMPEGTITILQKGWKSTR